MAKAFGSNIANLYENLKELFGERLEIDPFSFFKDSINGKIDGIDFTICYTKDKYLLAQVYSATSTILNELTPILSKIMRSNPLCSYNLQEKGVKDYKQIIEWNCDIPCERLMEIISGWAFEPSAQIHNLKVLINDKLTTAKIYGIYPGNIDDVDEIISLDEIGLFFKIESVKKYILFKSRHRDSFDLTVDSELEEAKFALSFMIYQTKKFGINLPPPNLDRQSFLTPSFLRWYESYSSHFKNFLSNEQLQEFMAAKEQGLDISKYMPKDKHYKKSL